MAGALEPLSEAVIRETYDLAKLGPTSVNMNPARLVWVVTPESKQKLAALASATNGAKVLDGLSTTRSIRAL
jgi:3-hydroxypropanoate dehydrogenase